MLRLLTVTTTGGACKPQYNKEHDLRSERSFPVIGTQARLPHPGNQVYLAAILAPILIILFYIK